MTLIDSPVSFETVLQYEAIIGQGAQGDVFAVGDKAYKLFRAQQWPYVIPQDSQFVSQVRAQQIVAADPELALHVPTFHGTTTIASVLHNGVETIDRYSPDFCYVMDRIPAGLSEVKLNSLGGYRRLPPGCRLPHLIERFRAVGVRNIYDATVFGWETERPLFVDFAAHFREHIEIELAPW